jgi:hypothetical protein
MSYTKQVWNSGVSGGTPISASALNYMENGIEQSAGVVMTKAQRVALAGMTTGYRVYESDTGFKLYYDGTRFRYEGDRVTVATLAARDALTPYDGLTALVSSATQTDGGEWLYFGGITAWIRLNVWNYLLYSTSYSYVATAHRNPGQCPQRQLQHQRPARSHGRRGVLCPSMGNRSLVHRVHSFDRKPEPERFGRRGICHRSGSRLGRYAEADGSVGGYRQCSAVLRPVLVWCR